MLINQQQKSKTMDILQKTMDEMPNVFTSNAFNKRAVKNGYPKELINHNGLELFIRRFATNQHYGSKTWVKKQEGQQINNASTEAQQLSNASTEVEKMIDCLKRKGYKVMRPTTGWKEC